jgi:hypothetical protein
MDDYLITISMDALEVALSMFFYTYEKKRQDSHMFILISVLCNLFSHCSLLFSGVMLSKHILCSTQRNKHYKLTGLIV